MTLHKLESLLTTLCATRAGGKAQSTSSQACAPRAMGLGHGICYKATVIAPFYSCTPTPIRALTLVHR